MQETSSQRRSRRRYLLESGASMVAYGVVTMGVLLWLRANPVSPWRPVVALVPLLPLGLGVSAVVRLYRRADERVRRIHVEALAFAFVVSAPLMVTYGFLETAGFPKISAWWFWITMGLAWALGRLIVTRRYR